MYYLLEDNRIIQRDRLEHWEEKGFLHDHYKTYGKIKKKSENVFDFIEVGDLVRFNWGYEIGEVTTTQFHNEWKRITVGKRDGVYDENILAIYKPDKQGNYIKVWEKENENDR